MKKARANLKGQQSSEEKWSDFYKLFAFLMIHESKNRKFIQNCFVRIYLYITPKTMREC
jgi:hypothetical protein